MKLIKTIDISTNDVYFLETVNDNIIINNNYNGIIIMDDKLNTVKVYNLFNDLIIDYSFKKNNEILLFCIHNKKIIHIDLIKYTFNFISYGFNETFLNPIDWIGDDVILMDNNDCLKILNLKSNTINIPDVNNMYYCTKGTYLKLRGYRLYKNFPFIKKAVVKIGTGEFNLIDYTKNIKTIAKIPFGNFHDFDIINNYIVGIAENEIMIVNLNHPTIDYSTFLNNWNYSYLRAKFMIAKNVVFMFILNSYKSNNLISKIEKYRL